MRRRVVLEETGEFPDDRRRRRGRPRQQGQAQREEGTFIVALVPAMSDATLVGYCSDPLENLGQCNKTVTYDSTTKTLTITPENTSPAANGGFLTADAFDLGAPASADIEVLS
jgi:hypothetical protein